MKDSYSIVTAPDGIYDLLQNVFNSDGTLQNQILVKRYKSKSGAKNALKRLEMKKRWEQGEIFVETLDLSRFKLLPNAKPSLFHHHTVRNNVSRNLWLKKVRPTILELKERKCSICGWTPVNDSELKNLHLHEIENYDFHNKVCHLLDIELICVKCHSFHHIARTKSVVTKEQWKDLLNHFVKINDCSPEIVEYWTHFERKVFRLENEKVKEKFKDLPPFRELMDKTVRYIVNPNIPFADEMLEQIEKKGLLYQPENQYVE